MQTLGVVLAGGKSSRMGRNKALLSMPDQPDVSLLMHMQQLLRTAGCAEVWVSGAMVGGLPDRVPELGPLAGIDSVFAALPDNDTHRLLVVPIDMPALTADLLRQLCVEAGDRAAHFAEYVLPACLPVTVQTRVALQSVLQTERRSLQALMYAVGASELPIPAMTEPAFANLNTPEEWGHWHSRGAEQ